MKGKPWGVGAVKAVLLPSEPQGFSESGPFTTPFDFLCRPYRALMSKIHRLHMCLSMTEKSMLLRRRTTRTERNQRRI
jgi:hypothetical protein